MTSQEKADRLAAQLRENLRKRKAQARAVEEKKEPVMPDVTRHPPSEFD